MEAWKKVKDFLLLVGIGLLAIFGITWAVKRFERSKEDHFGIDPSERKIGDNITGQGSIIETERQTIDRQRQSIDRAIELAGRNQERELDIKRREREGQERERETTGIVEESRKARQRAKDFIAKLED